MRELTMTELDVVAGGYAGYDSTDYNSEMGVNMPIEDHGAYVEAQAQSSATFLWVYAQLNSQLDAFAKPAGFSDFNEMQRQAALQQQNTCSVDPIFANMMASPTFAQAMNSIVSASQSNHAEYAINYYGDGHWSSIMTSYNPQYVNATTSDILNFWYGWADGHDTPIMVIDYTANGGTAYYCYNPSSEN